jgi:two-component sensor histidine kinase
VLIGGTAIWDKAGENVMNDDADGTEKVEGSFSSDAKRNRVGGIIPVFAGLIPKNSAFIPNSLTESGFAPLSSWIGVQCRVLRAIMQWAIKQKGWRALLVRWCLLTTVWLVVAFVFATEIYLTAPGGPIRVTWGDAAGNAIRDWFPWILLSPAAVLLANRFRFDRDKWRRNLLVHVGAIFLFAIAYEALEMLFLRGPFILSTGTGVITVGEGGNPRFAGLQVAHEMPPPRWGTSNDFSLERIVAVNGMVTAFSTNSSNVFVVQSGGRSELPLSTTGFGDFRGIPQPGRWSPFLHLMLGRTRLIVPIYLCIVCVCWLFNHYQEANERQRRTLELESRLTQANLQALKMQLQPHFLFNTLNTISSLIHESPALADDMVSSLSQFLRTTLDVSSKNEIPLHEELEFVERYLEIQQVRFGDRLLVRRNVEANTMDALVPPLLLQPLVENAIRYGVETRERGGVIAVQASQQGDTLRLEISDDGQGFGSRQLLGAGNGVGLSNTIARLQTLYGDNHQFKLTTNQPTGACVKIEIPFRIAPSNNQEVL